MNLMQRALEKLAAIRGKRPELEAAGVAPEAIDAQLNAEAEQVGREMVELMTQELDGVQADGSVIVDGQRYTVPTMTDKGMVVPPRTWNQ